MVRHVLRSCIASTTVLFGLIACATPDAPTGATPNMASLLGQPNASLLRAGVFADWNPKVSCDRAAESEIFQ
jgi:hypothetical protein